MLPLRGLTFLFCMLFLLQGVAAAQEPLWHYAYLTRDDNNEDLLLHYVEPISQTSASYGLANSSDYLASVQPSPDGRWLILWFNEYPAPDVAPPYLTSYIRLIDLEQGEMFDIAQFPYVIDDWGEYPAYDAGPLWSPDSRFITFHNWVYDLEIKSLSILPLQDEFPFGRAWSTDSTKLAFADSRCTESYCSGVSLEIFDTTTWTSQQNIEYDLIFDICKLEWSPDNRYIVFQNHCSFIVSGLYSPHREVFIWDVEDSQVTQITNFTSTPPWEETPPDLFASYDTLWLDDETLLISVVEGMRVMGEVQQEIDRESFAVESLLYKLPEEEFTHLNDLRLAESLTLGDTVAYRTERIELNDEGNTIVYEQFIELASWNGSELTALSSAPAGCRLRSSSDGMFLAYYILPVDDLGYSLPYGCSSPVSLVFLEATGEVHQYVLPSNVERQVGWLRTAPPDVPIFLQGTPTPMPPYEAGGAAG